MSLSSMIVKHGVTVSIIQASKSQDAVNTDIYDYSGIAASVTGYVSDAGRAFLFDNDTPSEQQTVTVYLPVDTSVTTDDRLTIDGRKFHVMSVTQPGLRSTGILSHKAVVAISDPKI